LLRLIEHDNDPEISRVHRWQRSCSALSQDKRTARNATTRSTLRGGSMEKCTTCQFYDRKLAKGGAGGAPSWGQCRRSAPLLNPVNAKSYMIEGIWPTVRDDDWCGEWKLLARRVDSRVAEALNAPLMGPHSLTPTPRPAPLTTASAGFSTGAASSATIVTPAVMGRSASD
jgi:hypothetical protein